MSEILTNQGLMLPDNYTEEEFFAAGRFLSRIEQGMQWAIGDWYNAIPWGDKKAACDRAGLNYQTAMKYGQVAMVFQLENRIHNCTFKHHLLLIIQELTSQQRADLMENASKNGWSSARLTKERDILLGRQKLPLLTFDGHVQQLLDTLPSSASKKTRAAVERVVSDLRHDFENEVHNAANAKLKEQRERLNAMEKEAKEELERARNLRMNLNGLMTEEEYRLILGCLHPDRAPEDRKQVFSKAFTIFNRLEKSVNRDMPIALRRKQGWS